MVYVRYAVDITWARPYSPAPNGHPDGLHVKEECGVFCWAKGIKARVQTQKRDFESVTLAFAFDPKTNKRGGQG